jgi:hypothetical protein
MPWRIRTGGMVGEPLVGDFLWWQRGRIGRIQGVRYADGMLFVGGRRHLAAFEATTGRPPWSWLATTRRSVGDEARVQL